MAFDIYQQVFDRDGVPVEKKAWVYIDGLIPYIPADKPRSNSI